MVGVFDFGHLCIHIKEMIYGIMTIHVRTSGNSHQYLTHDPSPLNPNPFGYFF